MFSDRSWIESRTQEQEVAFEKWMDSVRGKRLVVLECGAGLAVPSIRVESSRIATSHGGALIRINPRDSEVLPGQISLPVTALDGIYYLTDNISDYPY